MRVLQHAMLSLIRKPTKAIMIFGILLVVFAMIFTGIIINNSVEQSKIAIRTEMGSIVDYTVNYIQAMNDELDYDDYEQLDLSKEVAETIAADPQVKKLYITHSGYVQSENYKSGVSDDSMMSMGGMEGVFMSLLTNSQTIPYEFESGTYSLTSGRYLTVEEINSNAQSIILNESFAAKNDLAVGNTVSFQTYTEGELDFEIVGLFTSSTKLNSDVAYTSYIDDMDAYISSIQFLLTDPLEVEAFINRNSDKLPSDYTSLTSGDKQYRTLTKPLDFITIITNLFIGVVFVAGAIIIIALVTIFVRDRKFEIGLLLSSGESRLKIVSQFIIELMAIAIVAFIISLTASQLSSGFVTEWIAENQLVEEDVELSDDMFIFNEQPSSFKKISLEEVANDFSAHIGPDVILRLFLSSSALVLVAASIPMVIIMSYKPREALQS